MRCLFFAFLTRHSPLRATRHSEPLATPTHLLNDLIELTRPQEIGSTKHLGAKHRDGGIRSVPPQRSAPESRRRLRVPGIALARKRVPDMLCGAGDRTHLVRA